MKTLEVIRVSAEPNAGHQQYQWIISSCMDKAKMLWWSRRLSLPNGLNAKTSSRTEHAENLLVDANFGRSL